MSETRIKSLGSQLIVASLFLVAGLGLITFFVLFAQPPERAHRTAFIRNYSEDRLLSLLSETNLQKTVTRIADASVKPGERQIGRLTGSPGFYRTETLIRDTFAAAGLEVRTQEFEVVVPETEFCEILGADGTPLPGVTLYPFEPSGLVPQNVPPEGIRARLVETESADLTLLTGNDPKRTIVLTYLDAAGSWPTLAGVGVRALVVREDEVAKAMRSDPDQVAPWASMLGAADMAYPRFVARGPIEKFSGQDVTIRSKVAWKTKRVRNVVGLLRGKGGGREALILNSYYDSSSVVPELAPGAEQSLSLVALLELAQALGQYKGEMDRDIIFVATAGHAQALTGVCRLMDAVEHFTERRRDYQPFEQRQAEERRRLDYAERALVFCGELARSEAGAGTRMKERLAQEADFRNWFESGIKVVSGEVNLERREDVITAKLAYFRAGKPIFREGFDALKATDAERAMTENTHLLLQAYIAAQTKDNVSGNMMSLPVLTLAERPEFGPWGYLAKATHYFEALREYHRQRIKELADTIELRKLLVSYERTLTLNLDLYSGGGKARNNLALLVGIPGPGTVVEPQVTDLANAFIFNVPAKGAGKQFEVIQWGSRDASGSKQYPNSISPYATELESEVWFRCGRLAFTLANYDFYPTKACTPEDTWTGMSLKVMGQHVPVLGRSVLALAAGQVPLKSIKEDRGGSIFSLRGTLFGSAGSADMIPSHPMWPNTFTRAGGAAGSYSILSRGVNNVPVMQTSPYGEFRREFAFDLGGSVSVLGMRFDKQGQIVFVNEIASGNRAVFSSTIPGSDVVATGAGSPREINLTMFRCVPVALYDQINPQTMKRFKGVSYIDRLSFSSPARSHFEPTIAFLDPDLTFMIGLQDGSANNKELLADRAFMLNVDRNAPISAGEPEIHGAGYLAADTPVLTTPMFDAAASMLRTAEKRLQLQERFGMADELMLSFHKQAKEWLAEAHAKWEQKDPSAAVNAAGTSEAYAINNYPVIRSRISQAVVGIIWYLGLLVPFVFFAEKLLFGYTDIRKQLLATGVIFLVVFALLRIFHPAFEIVRSSMMILLGFLILLLSLLVTMMVGGKFKQNLKDLRSKEGQVEGADISRGGVVGTAFMLGLNNMRRRKIRTGLTCGTLVLITFVMICFTSVSTDLVNVEQPTGRSSWNGLMIRDPNFRTLDANEVSNIRQIYGNQYPVTVHRWLATQLKISERGQNAEILMDREFLVNSNKVVKRGRVNAAVEMAWNEPIFTGMDRYLITKKGWFTKPPQDRKERMEALSQGYQSKRQVILPDAIARDLGISSEDVDAENPVIVTLRGVEYEVHGIFDSIEMGKCLGLDGQSLLPFDVNTMQNVGVASDGTPIIPENTGRLPASQVILVNVLPAAVGGEAQIVANCFVLFPKAAYRVKSGGAEYSALDYRSQRKLVLGYLERIGQPAYYAIDGVSYYGSRQRSRSFAGLLELLVPILIAALTVFSTMRGSVYERRSEIYVYNAVGIAPNHVFFMFMAEACVYAVVGAVMGYILSQGTGRLLTALDMTGGMKMDYSSIETIYASLAIMGSVLLSTIVPARDAAKLAAPSDTVSWTVPKAEGDRMIFNLPFTFTAHDRVAVISYFQRWLDANGAGSSGPFFCSPPSALLEIRKKEGTDTDELVPAMTSTVWLKPYDLGVSQRMEISLPTDPETSEYVARITLTRLSGNTAGWNRTLVPFMGVLRKQFLNWRATTDAERREMFTEANRILNECVEKEGRHA
ncbi:MAG: FtsX-like permease family protein [bacterium]